MNRAQDDPSIDGASDDSGAKDLTSTGLKKKDQKPSIGLASEVGAYAAQGRDSTLSMDAFFEDARGITASLSTDDFRILIESVDKVNRLLHEARSFVEERSTTRQAGGGQQLWL